MMIVQTASKMDWQFQPVSFQEWLDKVVELFHLGEPKKLTLAELAQLMWRKEVQQGYGCATLFLSELRGRPLVGYQTASNRLLVFYEDSVFTRGMPQSQTLRSELEQVWGEATLGHEPKGLQEAMEMAEDIFRPTIGANLLQENAHRESEALLERFAQVERELN
jgi:hypothetical protein